ncbi:hypothetical protein ACIBH1_30295 [Nonomuraea sp. NPDC050663]|uniref:hypothetical protein n=1 Tax=Nonomuraea sp. NPDC050663 TaxID=3364370 RepID=UPI0037AB2C54
MSTPYQPGQASHPGNGYPYSGPQQMPTFAQPAGPGASFGPPLDPRQHSRRRPPPRGAGFYLLAIGLPALILGGGLGAGSVLALQALPKPTASAEPTQSVPSAFTAQGTITVEASRPGTKGRSCSTDGGYSDIREGAQVVITDAKETTLAVGQLAMGYYSDSGKCEFPFSVEVKSGEAFYGIEVSHRGRLQYSASDMASPLSLSLGD